jgi:ABC-type sugar transport system permease subunit
MVIYLAGLTGISRDILDAAAMDGANTFQLVRHVVLGVIRPVIALSFLLSIIGNFQPFAIIYATTGGGPLHRTEVVGTYTYYLAFAYQGPQEMGYAAAFSAVLTTFLFLFAIFRIRATRLV